MLGNVQEWCQDRYGDFSTESVTDPTGPTSGDTHVMRGGSMSRPADNARCASRGGYINFLYADFGFRVCCDAPPPATNVAQPTGSAKTQPALQTAPTTSPLASIRPEELRRGLVLYFSFDNIQGARVVDESGSGNHGTINGIIYSTNGVVGQAVVFNGIKAFIQVPKTPSLNLNGPLTMSAWVKPESTEGFTSVLAKEYNFKGYHLSIDGGAMRASVSGSKGISGSIPVRQWTHLVAVCTSSNLLQYINGKLVNTADATTPQDSSTDLYLGCWMHPVKGPSRFFNGLLDEVRIYNRALSDEEVRHLYELNNTSSQSTIRVQPTP
jgi:hypothetical protein